MASMSETTTFYFWSPSLSTTEPVKVWTIPTPEYVNIILDEMDRLRITWPDVEMNLSPKYFN